MVEVELGGKYGTRAGRVAVVDEAHRALVSNYSWHAVKAPHTFYAYTKEKTTRRSVSMHSLVIGKRAGLIIDHVNGDGLDNRLANLRHATYTENNRNRRKGESKTSTFKGLYWHTQKARWHAQIQDGRKLIHIGYFLTAEEAALAYDYAARNMHGEFAALNFPLEGERSALR